MQRDTSSWGLPPLPGPFDSDAKLSCLGDSAARAHVLCVCVGNQRRRLCDKGVAAGAQ